MGRRSAFYGLVLLILSSMNCLQAIDDFKKIPLYNSGNRNKTWNRGGGAKDHYLDNVQPVLSARCASCHSCYEGPCQLNFQSYELADRGYHFKPLYATKKPESVPRRRYYDAHSPKGWERLGFRPVINKENPEDGLIYQLLTYSHEKNKSPFNLNKLYKEIQSFEEKAMFYPAISTNEDFEKVAGGNQALRNPFSILSIDSYKSKYKSGGMPFALSSLEQNHHDTLIDWLKNRNGAGPSTDAIKVLKKPSLKSKDEEPLLLEWRKFFNPSLNENAALWNQRQLISRYVYEHVYAATIKLSDVSGEFFEIVRSETANGKIKMIVTDTVMDKPSQVKRVYYRFKKIDRAIVQKKHIIWKLDENKLVHLKELFSYNKAWPNQKVHGPDYSSKNPFRVFAQIPARMRSKFMMENSHVVAGGMVQGSVCIGSRATYAIRDHFWVWFLSPDVDPSVVYPNLGLKNPEDMGTTPIKFKSKEMKKYLGWEEPDIWPIEGNVAERAAARVHNGRVRAQSALHNKVITELLNEIEELDNLDRLSNEHKTVLTNRMMSLAGRFGLIDKNLIQSVNKLSSTFARLKIQPSRAFTAIFHYIHSIKANQRYAAAYENKLRLILNARNKRDASRPNALTANDLWDGTGDNSYSKGLNPNAWVQIVRHGRSATVHYGSDGGDPGSIWVLSYSNFERLYYNLVVLYKEFGNVPQKLATWRHMSYIRLEAEDLAISFLPSGVRKNVRDSFTKGMVFDKKQEMFFPHHSMEVNEVPSVRAGDPEFAGMTDPQIAIKSLVKKAKGILGSIDASHDGAIGKQLGENGSASWRELNRLTQMNLENKERFFEQFLPELVFVRVGEATNDAEAFTFLNDRSYKAHNIVFGEARGRDPELDSLSLYRGFIGAYPGRFIQLADKLEAKTFVDQVLKVTSKESWLKVMARYGIDRTEPGLWEFFDWIHLWKSSPHPANDPDEQGIVDLQRYSFDQAKPIE